MSKLKISNTNYFDTITFQYPLSQQITKRPEYQNLEAFDQSNEESDNSSKPVFWDSNYEAKGKDDDKIFKLS